MKSRLARGGFILTILVLAASVAVPRGAPAATRTCAIRYLSSEHVYLDAGASEGVVPGMKAQVLRGGQAVAVLEVVYVADHSSSWKVISSQVTVAVGDDVVIEGIVEAGPGGQQPPADKPAPRTRETLAAVSAPTASRVEVSGNVGLQWDHTDTSEEPKLGTDYLAMPFRVRAEGLGKGWEFRTKGTLRWFSRSGYSSTTPAQEWLNRIREVALVQDDPQAAWNVSLGRITTRFAASAGPFDGLFFDRRLGSGVRLGAFGGFAPQWGSYAFSTDDRLGGVTFHLSRRTEGGRMVDMVLAGIGRYRLGEISREYLALTTTWRDGSRLMLLQAAEIDLNRGWRRDAQGQSVSLSSLALTANWQAGRGVNVNLGYDDRELVRTLESRSLPDSLFEDSGRRGWRAGLGWRAKGGRRLDVAGSLQRDHRLQADVKSWNGRFYWPRFSPAAVDFSAAVRGFTGPYLKGWAPQMGLYRSFGGGTRLGAEGGYYLYEGIAQTDDRTNTWMRLNCDRELSRRWSMAAQYQRDWGDDMAGKRWLLEMRHRF
jgi:hypothetical protein